MFLRWLTSSSRKLQVVASPSADDENCYSHVLQKLHGLGDVICGEAIGHPNEHFGHIDAGTSFFCEQLLLGKREGFARVSIAHHLLDVAESVLHRLAGMMTVKGELHGGHSADVDNASLDLVRAKGERLEKISNECLDPRELIVGDASRAVQQEEEVPF